MATYHNVQDLVLKIQEKHVVSMSSIWFKNLNGTLTAVCSKAFQGIIGFSKNMFTSSAYNNKNIQKIDVLVLTYVSIL